MRVAGRPQNDRSGQRQMAVRCPQPNRDLASSMGDTELGRSSVFSPTAREEGKGRSTGKQAARAKYRRLCKDRPVAMLYLLPVLC